MVTPEPAGTPTGSVTFSIDGTPQTPSQLHVVDGQVVATFSPSALAPGPHTIVASYGGDNAYSGSTSNTTIVIVNATSTQLSSSANPASPGQSVTFTAIVSPPVAGTPTGSVTFAIDGKPQNPVRLMVVNGHDEATLSTSAIAIGNHSVTAAYSGDSQFAGSTSNSLVQSIIMQVPSGTRLSATPSPAAFGQTVQLMAAISSTGGTPTGSVIFSIDGQPQPTVPLSLVNGKSVAILNTSSLSVGNHFVTAFYSGSSTFAGSVSNPVNVAVTAATTTLQLSSSTSLAKVGQQVTLSAVVVPPFAGLPTGSVTFTIDGRQQRSVALTTVNGRDEALFTTKSLTSGNHTITATYGGSVEFSSSTASRGFRDR